MNFLFENDIQLENDFALLRPLMENDLINLFAAATADTDLLQYSPSPIYNKELLEKYIGKALENRLSKNRYTFCVFDKIRNKYAGCTSYLNISNADDRLEIGGTWYAKEFQKTGLNRNCKFLLLEYAFEILGAERIEFKTDERNIASRTAIEKIGGKFEGILRNHTLMSDGFRRNTVSYSMLKDEWEKIKKDEVFNSIPKKKNICK
ncbi:MULTISPECIES: GNAT family N-acetyltransferase [Flavobacterium]|uniref:Protein N-acetyltransferase, RimJ/RimL family n=1 Tax=Flavobacterium defluvii TaxID=370979 RepID=A0A1M5J4M4_9FLAO|nr:MULTISPECIES: GNAT family protein [Flavobacterium]EJG02148.1 putative amino-acid acetyltransferase [Flavobacterium sp. F52]SHG34963.1 Protein N-acetyltransferase, RimJ/RimL family [Flavobacterium defluvii]